MLRLSLQLRLSISDQAVDEKCVEDCMPSIFLLGDLEQNAAPCITASSISFLGYYKTF